MTKTMRCEGYRRSGDAFNLGPVRWEQCGNDAAVSLTVLLKPEQDGTEHNFPVCQECWQEAIQNEIPIHQVKPITLCTPQS